MGDCGRFQDHCGFPEKELLLVRLSNLLYCRCRPAREEFEGVLASGVQQVVLAMQRNPSSAKLFAWGCRAFAALALRPPAPPLDSHSGASSDNNYCAGSSNNCTASQPTLDKFFILLDSSVACENKDRRSLSAEGAAAALGNDVPLWLFVIRSFLALVPREAPQRAAPAALPVALGRLERALRSVERPERREALEQMPQKVRFALHHHMLSSEAATATTEKSMPCTLPPTRGTGSSCLERRVVGVASRCEYRVRQSLGRIEVRTEYDSSSRTGVPIAPGALRESGLCALGALRLLCDHADASSAAIKEILKVLPGAPAPLLAWAASAFTVLSCDGRHFAEMVLQASITVNSKRASSESLLPSLSNLLLAAARGTKQLQGVPSRPPGSGMAAEMANGLLSSLRKLPAAARNGAGGGSTAPDGNSRGRATLRDGHIAVGDVVKLHNDLERAKREQEPPEHFGGWCDRMAFCLDFPGRVVEIPRRSPRMPEVLRISHGALGCWCWNAKAVAEVITDTDLLPFEEDECGPGAALTIGDEVRIDVTVDEAKQLQAAGLQEGDNLTAIARQAQLAASLGAFALWFSGGEKLITWGHPGWGGDSSAVQDRLKKVQQVKASSSAFAATLADGSVVTWGDPDCGADSSAVQDRLRNVQQVQATGRSFAAILADGSVVTWGHARDGGDSSEVQQQLKNVHQIQAAAQGAFAAILRDGSIVTWGDPDCGGKSSKVVQRDLRNVQQVRGNACAFAAILTDETVAAWGDPHFGGDISQVREQLRSVQEIQATYSAFAAILADGSVVTWGDRWFGGDSSAAQDQLRNVQQVQATDSAFAAILADGSVVTWGNADHGGNSSAVQDRLRNVQQVKATHAAFAAILSDRSVLAWGDARFGGDSSQVEDQLKNVQQVAATHDAFAAIIADGSVVNHGGWNDRMTQCCGRVGRLEAIDKAGDMKVLVPGAGAFVWNPRALRSLHAQRWESALCERLSGSMEGTLPLALLAALSCLGSRLDSDGLKAATAELIADAQSSQDGGFQGWTVLAIAALIVDPAMVKSVSEAKLRTIQDRSGK
eukprot:s3653_g1.t6